MYRLIERLIIFGGLCLFAWILTAALSPGAIEMALGLLFGILAGLPVVLLVLASDRRQPSPPPRTREPDWLTEPERWELLEERRVNQVTERNMQTSKKQRERKYIEVK